MAKYIKIKNKNIRLPGLRNIKTAIAVYICIILYHLFNLGNPLVALFSVVICMQQNISESVKEGKNRILGTFFGGAFAFLFLNMLHLDNFNIYVQSTILSMFLIFIIYILNLFKRSEAISLSAVVFLLIVFDSSNDSILKVATLRTIDTTIGIVVAVLVNRFLFHPKNPPKDPTPEIHPDLVSDSNSKTK